MKGCPKAAAGLQGAEEGMREEMEMGVSIPVFEKPGFKGAVCLVVLICGSLMANEGEPFFTRDRSLAIPDFDEGCAGRASLREWHLNKAL